MALWDDIAGAYNAADDWYKKHTKGAAKVRDKAVGGVEKALTAGPTADPFSKGNKDNAGIPKVGGGGDGPDPTKNLPMIIRDELTRQYPGAPITDQQVNYIAAQLASAGLTADKATAKDYRSAVDKWTQSNPGAQQYYAQYNPFGSQSTPGMLSPQQAQAMWAAADQYEKPYIDDMKNTSNQMAAYLKQLMPSLPKGYQSLVHAQMEGPGGLLNLPSQVSNLIHQENPAAIANAYALAYGGGSGGTTNSNNAFNSIVPQIPTTKPNG